MSSWILVGFITAEPQQELPIQPSFTGCLLGLGWAGPGETEKTLTPFLALGTGQFSDDIETNAQDRVERVPWAVFLRCCEAAAWLPLSGVVREGCPV